MKNFRRSSEKNLNQVHATVSFIPEASGTSVAANSKRGYDADTAAVLRARKQILIVGDYCPPPGEGAALDKLPEHRSEFLQAIEAMLAKRLEGDPGSAPLLEYRRFIQRPINVYNMIKGREMAGNPGITLEPGDTVGDIQVFEHCMRVLDIVTRDETREGERIRVQIKVIPFLPNRPSVLLVDDRDVQFIIPTRIDSPGDKCAQQGLLGAFVLEDKAGGSEVCYPFTKLFDKISSILSHGDQSQKREPQTVRLIDRLPLDTTKTSTSPAISALWPSPRPPDTTIRFILIFSAATGLRRFGGLTAAQS
ncbi:MAG: hypothetical protein ACRDRI_01665 [Pseudonocardiaceae bacterium]